ncbi:BnaA08g05180D [Brassica napus]|uniref:BnaA08g05180D protein n=1 Tax=Brassica napus TaxID=3708 RepID=A0A078I0T0_BRANA|nr:BnaA08g05180D [Brassica napus]
MATLKSCISRRPKPPTSLCCVRLSQATQHMFLVEGS